MKLLNPLRVVLAVLGLTGCVENEKMKLEEYIELFKDSQAKALVMAIGKNDAQAVSRLHAAGADFNVEGEYGKTPLRLAIQFDKPEIVDLLLSYGADPNYQNESGAGAAKAAIEQKDPAYLRLLLAAGLDPDIKYLESPIIIIAIKNNRWTHYDMLVESGADLSAKADNGATVALYMAMQFEYERLKILIEIGVDVKAASDSDFSVVESLTDMQKRFSGNPEHRAYKMRIELLEMLKKKGLEIPPGIPGVRYE